MQTLRTRLIHLHRCRGITRHGIRRLLHQDPTLKQIYLLSSTQIHHLLTLPMKNAIALHSDLHNQELKNQIYHDMNRYRMITIVDENYPSMLKPIKDPPIVLYAMGNISLLKRFPAISVIGTRNPSHEAMKKIEYIVKPLIDLNWVIISGMAKGIDSYAHRLALLSNGATIAIMGSGFHHIYPKQHEYLFKQIAENGLVLSEYPPNVSPKPYHFPERNRIISGLCFGTLVIEATEKSGTLITVNQALDQGREVYAIPGSPLIPQTKGCHRMIQDGAKLVQQADDIIEDWESFGLNWIAEKV